MKPLIFLLIVLSLISPAALAQTIIPGGSTYGPVIGPLDVTIPS